MELNMAILLLLYMQCQQLIELPYLTQQQAIEKPVFQIKFELDTSYLAGLPIIASIHYAVPVYKYMPSGKELDKMPLDLQSKIRDYSISFEIQLSDITDRVYPLAYQIISKDGVLLSPHHKPGFLAYTKYDPRHHYNFPSKQRIWAGGKPSVLQLIDTGNLLADTNPQTVNIQYFWYQFSGTIEPVSTNMRQVAITVLGDSDKLLLKDFMNQPEYKSKYRNWLNCEINYGALRDKLSKQAKKQLAVYGFLRSVINARKIEYSPVHWLDDMPELLKPLALTLRYEVALSEQKKAQAADLEITINKDYPGLYWEIRRIKEGKGMLSTILKEGLGR